jgi:hypothetical protein
MATEPPPADLLRARNRFQAWRKQRQGRSRIPGTLWKLAIRLATSHGVSRTATALGVDYYTLKRRLEDVGGARQTSGSAFVELAAPVLAGKQCLVELDSGAGTRMRVQLLGYETADIEALVRSYLG